MPEGDTLHRAAARVGAALIGRRLVTVEGTHRAVARDGRRLTGRTVTGVEAIGKHLLVHTDGGWTVRTHLGMTGRWVVLAPDAPWRTSPGKARLVLRTAEAVAVCFAAPTVEIGPTSQVHATVGRLGPDLVDDAPPLETIVTRARASMSPTVADLLLDQQVASGVGNVYKSEVLFLERLAPVTSPADLDDGILAALYRRAHRLLVANVTEGQRTTTGSRRPGRNYWVYGRAGRPCRRCGAPIASTTHGRHDRVTYWCPTCQPQPSASSRSTVNG